MTKIRIAQYGTKHGHARGKVVALQSHPDVELAGVFEPDVAQRQQLQEAEGPFQPVHWFETEDEMLADKTIIAVASEGQNSESLAQTAAIVQAGKHVWYDKPAGEDWAQWQTVVADAKRQNLLIQMGYMFRYHTGFRTIADWARSGLLGNIFSIRAHMSTFISAEQRRVVGEHQGGIMFDLGGHVLDQIVWTMGRPHTVTSFLRNDDTLVANFTDNTLTVLEYDRGIAFVDIAAMETKPMARRYEVYGDRGSAIIVDPFEPAETIRLCLDAARDGYQAGEQFIPLDIQSRQSLYDLALDSFLATITGHKDADRSYEHELLVQETLLRVTGKI
ncbi:MAG: Gfo/Idh/MocA family oxidoreductase [Chloroflexota bacterium]